ncbi:DUF4340 domain-containing protein [Tahibacter amnicola]|uniref:DUF4340 domain-containing protein n=1 Tax=Tahibacter amnicola TaxID=2976241 RepID=A0ABY6BHW9_9GAMM|nr:DUF4340 domain-containing protein [Tahibacter amnicola]UXI69591.1 DUF4340 domain-containing protein [Tahibacter amnicola]
MNHVTQKNVLGLGVATVLAIGIGVAITTSRQPQSEGSQAETYALPELRDHLNEVKSLTLSGAGQKVIATIERGDKGWTLKEKGGYPVDVAKLRKYLMDLSEARLLEPKTSNEQRYADLGVSDIGAADAKGVLVAIDGLGKPAQLIIGNPHTRGEATFVRRAGEKQSWLAKGSLVADKTPANWLDKSLMDISSNRIKDVRIQRPDGKSLHVFKELPTDTHFKVADIPKGRELSSEFAANAIGTTLTALTFEDVLPAAEAAPPADGKVHKATFTTFDGLTLTLNGWKKDEKAYARIEAALDEAAVEAAVVADQAKAKAEWEAKSASAPAAGGADAKPAAETAPLAVTDAAKDKAQRSEAIKNEFAQIRQRLDGWTFVLSTYKFSGVEKSMEDLLKPVEDKKAGAKAAAKPVLPGTTP